MNPDGAEGGRTLKVSTLLAEVIIGGRGHTFDPALTDDTVHCHPNTPESRLHLARPGRGNLGFSVRQVQTRKTVSRELLDATIRSWQTEAVGGSGYE